MAYTTIDKSDDYFNTVLYTGNGSSRSITGVNFQPDWVWIKGRSTAYSHILHDVNRGATKELKTNSTDAEGTDANGLTSFDSDGFSLGTGGAVNNSGTTFVSWNWLAANGTSSNTDGSITSTVSANTTAGFSIVKIDSMPANTVSTVGHGLGVKPDFIILKSRNNSTNWDVYHSSITPDAGKKVLLNATNAASSSGFMNSTPPTTSVFSFDPGGSDSNQIAYCFHSVKGYSKFGSYTGNGSSDGTFVYTGFKPAFIMSKRTNSTGFWNMFDTKRDINDGTGKQLWANSSDAEASSSGNLIDILSNGFKNRGTGNDTNNNGSTYIYMAFAENPFVTSTGIPGLAR